MDGLTLRTEDVGPVGWSRHREALERAALRRMMRSAPTARLPWLLRWQNRLLSRLGHGLVELGHWLEREAARAA